MHACLHVNQQLHAHSHFAHRKLLTFDKQALSIAFVNLSWLLAFREKQRLEAEAVAKWQREEEEARLAAEALAAAERYPGFALSCI